MLFKVTITTTKGDIKDTTNEMDDTQAFLANLASQCATKKKEWDERCKVRAEEVAAISEAIKILNDDDAFAWSTIFFLSFNPIVCCSLQVK